MGPGVQITNQAKMKKPEKELVYSSPQWNYEPCQAQFGTAVVDDAPPTWWCAGLVGKRVECIKITVSGSTPFYIYRDGDGVSKVFFQGGGPCSSHKGLECSDFKPTSEVYGRPVKSSGRWRHTRKTGGRRGRSKRLRK